MDVERHVVTVDGEEQRLPLKEFELLEMFLRNPGRVLTRGQLIDRVWGSDYVGDTKTLDVHVKRLRAKLEPDPGDAEVPRRPCAGWGTSSTCEPRRSAAGSRVRRPKSACCVSVPVPRLVAVTSTTPPQRPAPPARLPLAAVACTSRSRCCWASAFVAIRHLGARLLPRRAVAGPAARRRRSASGWRRFRGAAAPGPAAATCVLDRGDRGAVVRGLQRRPQRG